MSGTRTIGLGKMIGVAFAAFAFTFALVPLYRIACEKVFGVRLEQGPAQVAEARAAVVLHSDDASEAGRIAALSGLPSSVPEAVNSAARDAVAGIQSQLAVWDAVQNAW